ncbi:MAG TPA: hypothetical protein VHO92_05465 [Methanobacterium sp.]|nr:hypothetical protein [Methanobacterium sp.]
MEKRQEIKRGRGQHLKKNEVKTEILRYILDKNSPVLEPDIREHLKKKFGTNDSKTMKTHFQELQKLNCIKKIANVGKENEWRIDSIKQLNSIKENFKEIELHSCKKPIEILVNLFTGEIKYFSKGTIASPDEGTIRAYLRLSPTFFYLCMSTDIVELYYRFDRLNDYSNEISSHATAKGIDIDYSLYSRENSDPKSRLILLDSDLDLKLKIDSYNDFHYKELPYLAFKHCFYMDVLTGKDSMMHQYAKNYISLKESGTVLWDPAQLEKYVKSSGMKPSDFIHNNYLECSRDADDYLKKFNIK